MPPGDHADTDAVRDALTCPSCDYLLRGLEGDVVTCPECGTRCDLAKLVATRWTRPWFKAPFLNQLAYPVATVAFTLIGLMAVAIIDELDGRRTPTTSWVMGVAVLLVGVGLWLWTMNRTRHRFDGLEGPGLALLAHAVLVAYLFGALLGLSGLLSFIGGFIGGGQSAVFIVVGVVVLAIAAGSITGAVLGERFMAKRCIRAYLRRRHTRTAE
jgi:membrane protein DedA with SNARE-associated domain